MNTSHRKTLLLVEDDFLIAMSERASLEQRGYAVQVVDSGERALEAVSGHDRIDLVLMDIDLGRGIDGTEAAARILERRDLPIVFLSSHTETEFVERTESISSYGYVAKNSGITVLDASIKMAFKLHEAHGRIRESEEKYRHLHENADIGIGYYSPDGRVVSYNAIAARNMGGAPEDFIGKSIFEIFPEAEARFYMGRIERACGSAEAASYEDCIRLPGGEKWYLSIFTRIADAGGGTLGIQIISQDITAEKLASMALERDEAETVALFDTISEGIALNECVYDGAGAMVDYRVLKVNRAFYSVAEYKEGPVVGNLASVLYGMTQASITEFWKSHIEKNEVAHTEFLSPRRGRWFYISTSPIVNDRFVTCFIDITDRKAIERTIQESEERLSLVLEGSELAYWDWDLATNIVKRDERWAGMLGYALAELEPTTEQWVELCHPDDYQFIWESIQGHLAGNVGTYSIEYRLRTKDGRYRWIHDSGKVLRRDAAGRPLRACGTHRDVTDEKEKDGRIGQLLEEKELILREVHHRVKNNMNTMKSLVSLQRQSLSDSGVRAALLDVENRFNSMLVLYEKLNQSPSYLDVSIKPYLETLVEEIVGNFPNAATVTIRADIEDAVLGARLAQTLGIIVNELLTNIMKYAFAGIENPAIRIEARLEERRFSLRVRDNGVGMPDGIDFSQSSGLGLMLVEQLTKQIDGAIRIERGEGTRILLEFPYPA